MVGHEKKGMRKLLTGVIILSTVILGNGFGWSQQPLANPSTAISSTPTGSLTPPPVTSAQPIFSSDDADRFHEIMQTAQRQSLAQRSMGDIMQAIAQQFVGSAYREHLLDQTPQETLVTSLTQFDCVLFVETVLALARSIALQDATPVTFAAHLEDQRYYQGRLQDYCSRLHYWSDWIADNQARGNVRNITVDLGGEPLPKTLNFMSRHRASYPRLVRDDAAFACIQRMEARVQHIPLAYIPTRQIATVYSQLQSGDIVAIATRISGLDVTHTGLVYRDPQGRVGLIHASPAGAVVIAPDLQTYTSRVDSAIGIMVARPVLPQAPNTRIVEH